MVFASNDRLHARITPLFLEPDQTFISGQELKEDLKKLNAYYAQFQDEIKKVGVMKFAHYPPVDEDTLVGRLFDKHLKPWRENARANNKKVSQSEKSDEEFVGYLKKLQSEQRPYEGPAIPSDQVQSTTLTRMVPVQRGNWRLLPEGIENEENQFR